MKAIPHFPFSNKPRSSSPTDLRGPSPASVRWLGGAVQPGTPLRDSATLELGKAGDQVEVGNQVWLFILFDRPAAPDQSPFLKFDPRALSDPQNADWAEPEGITLADILHVLAPKLVLDGAGQPVGDFPVGTVVLFDQERVIGRIIPGRRQEIRLQVNADCIAGQPRRRRSLDVRKAFRR